MSHIQQLLEKEKIKLEKKLFDLVKLHDTPWLVKGFKALHRSNMALKRFIDTNEQDKKAYWWADKWNELRKYCVQQAKKTNMVSYSTKRVKMEAAISEINGQLWRYKIKDRQW